MKAVIFSLSVITAIAGCPLGLDQQASAIKPDGHPSVGVALRRVTAVGDAVDEYQNQTAVAKFNFLKSKIAQTPDAAPWPSSLDLANLFLEDMSITMDSTVDHFDQLPNPNRHKLIHSQGFHAEAKVTWLNNPYTGLFKKADFGFIRVAPAVAPDYSQSSSVDGGFTPGVGIKFFRDGVQSGNIVFLNSLEPVASWNFFKHELSNHLDTNHLSFAKQLLAKKFGTAPSDWAGFVGLNEFAGWNQDGAEIPSSTLNFPFQLVLKPDAALQAAVPDSGTGLELSAQVHGMKAGQHLYDIYAKATPTAPLQKIGAISLGSAFASSAYGDQRMFLQHTRYDDDLAYRPDFLKGCESAATCLVCPFQVAC